MWQTDLYNKSAGILKISVKSAVRDHCRNTSVPYSSNQNSNLYRTQLASFQVICEALDPLCKFFAHVWRRGNDGDIVLNALYDTKGSIRIQTSYHGEES